MSTVRTRRWTISRPASVFRSTATPGGLLSAAVVAGPPQTVAALPPRLRLQVHRQALLVAVHAEEDGALPVAERRPAAGFVADLGRFNLDDLGAEVAEILGAEGA